jgi:adsorption protein B
VVLDHDGPTVKADCLNAIWSAIQRDDAAQGEPTAIYVMLDCEDVIDPLACRLFNWLIPRKDMVQLPVLSLPRRWWEFTAAHYLDEFAQQHLKDLVVRETLARGLPAAGVGVAFSASPGRSRRVCPFAPTRSPRTMTWACASSDWAFARSSRGTG